MRYTIVDAAEFTYPDRWEYPTSSNAVTLHAPRGTYAGFQILLDGLWEEKKAAVEERIRRFVANFVALNGAATFAVVWLALKLFRRKEKE